MQVLALDLGTESARAAVFTEDGAIVGQGTSRYPTDFLQSGWAEQDPRRWISSSIEAAQVALAEASVRELAGVAVATTASSVVFLDEGFQPIRPAILWMDTRAHREATETAALGHPNMVYSGGVDSPEWLVPKAMWVSRHEPDIFLRSHYVGEAVDFVSFAFSGSWSGSILNATCKWNYDSRVGRLPGDLYEALGIASLADKLPQQILPVGSPIGQMTQKMADALGLRNRPVVSTGGIDAHMALVGLRGLSKNAVSVAAGTSNAFIAEADQQFQSSEVWGPYPDALTPGRWLAEGGQLSAGSALSWVAERMLGISRENLPGLWSRVENNPPAAHGLVVLDDFMGNRTPHRDAHMRGGILGLTLATRPEDVYQAAIEGVSFGTKEVVDSFHRAGISVSDLFFSGGISRNPLWLQATADVIGYPIHSVAAGNLTLLSTAATAAVGAEIFPGFTEAQEVFTPHSAIVEPRAHAIEALSEAYHVFSEAKAVNRPIFYGPEQAGVL